MTTRKRGSRGETEKVGQKRASVEDEGESRAGVRDRCSEEQRVRARDRYGESARERRCGGIERTNEREKGDERRRTKMESVRAGTRDRRRPLVTPDTQPSPRQFRLLKSRSTLESTIPTSVVLPSRLLLVKSGALSQIRAKIHISIGEGEEPAMFCDLTFDKRRTLRPIGLRSPTCVLNFLPR